MYQNCHILVGCGVHFRETNFKLLFFTSE